MRSWIVTGSLLALLFTACAPVGSVTLHDVVLMQEGSAERYRHAYGNAAAFDLDGASFALGDLVARSDVDDPFAVPAARMLDDVAYLLDVMEAEGALPFEVVRVPLTTDLELRTRADLESVHYFDGTRWFRLARDVAANVTRRITPIPTSTPLRGQGSLTPPEANAVADGLALRGTALAVATLAGGEGASDDDWIPEAFRANDPGGLEEYLHSVVYTQTSIPSDETTYREPGQRALFEVVARGQQGAAPEQDRFALVNDAAALSAFWSEVHATTLTPPPLPDVRFGSETLVAVQLSARPSTGYGIEVPRVERRDGEVFLDVVRTEPEAGTITSTVVTSPWILVRVLGIDADVAWFRDPVDGRLFAVARASEAPF